MSQTCASPRSSPHGSTRHGHLTSRPTASSRTPASVGIPSSSRAPVSVGIPSRTPAALAVHTPLRPLNHPSNPFAQDAREGSPNYFNIVVDAHSGESSRTGTHTRANWSPPSSQVRSTAAVSPHMIPLDQNPTYEAFRKQSDIRATGFSSGLFTGAPGPSNTQFEHTPPSPPVRERAISSSAAQKDSSPIEPQILEIKPRSPKRSLSSPYTNITDRPRKNSPAGFTDRDALGAPQAVQNAREQEVRFSLPSTTAGSNAPASHTRSETLPANLAEGSAHGAVPFASPLDIKALLDTHGDEVLLLDLRVFTQYAKSSLNGALNLCIPTTLLKRPSYNTQRLAETFKVEQQRQRFERWRSCKYIVVYDGSSTTPKDALACTNMLKKFASEGWTGQSYVIRGGFDGFSDQFPQTSRNNSGFSGVPAPELIGSETEVSSIAPVIGGCPMPSTKSAANPFFGNIRQNMDLIGGVGQMAVKLPSSMSSSQQDQLPQWLQEAASVKDNGKFISESFLHIEKSEQKRMQEALSSSVTYGTPTTEAEKLIKIAGIEKGVKNRYNNIWPFEHTRVKLEGVVDGACDYVNANHVKADWSNKRYVATQGPIPATFADFWNVVWQQDVRVIVMLTAEKEGGQVKAHNYWDAKRYGPMQLQFLSEHRASLEPSKIHRHNTERPSGSRRRSTNPLFGRTAPPSEVESPGSEQPYVIVRRFALSSEDEPFARMREITQLQYSNWPDFGAPAHPAHLLGLVEQCDAVVRAGHNGSASGPTPEEARPVLVHCSAGCGRTGTFCTVDSVIDMMKRQRTAQRSQQQSQQSQHRQPTPMEIDSASSGTESTVSIPSISVSSASAANDGSSDWSLRNDVDLIQKTVEDFRLQRLSMVQSLRQYVLCYETVLEWLSGQTPKSA